MSGLTNIRATTSAPTHCDRIDQARLSLPRVCAQLCCKRQIHSSACCRITSSARDISAPKVGSAQPVSGLDMRHAQVVLEAALKPHPTLLTIGTQTLKALAQFPFDNRTEQLILGRKVAVERPAAQPDRFHQAIDPYGRKPFFLADTALLCSNRSLVSCL